MKIFKNVLPEHLVAKCVEQIEHYKSRHVWGINDFLWSSNIQAGVQRAPFSTSIEDTSVTNEITKHINSLVPDFSTMSFQYYVWVPGSAISVHNDGNKKFGCTIYLSQNLDVNDGGLFLWQESSNKKWNVYMPERNSMVLNDEREHHLVTPVAYTNKNRLTIQIWGY